MRWDRTAAPTAQMNDVLRATRGVQNSKVRRQGTFHSATDNEYPEEHGGPGQSDSAQAPTLE